MNILAYGCSANLLSMRKNIKKLKLNIDYCDSKSSLWGIRENPYVPGDIIKIISPSDVNVTNYDYALVGSSKYENEIKDLLLKLGFLERQILPASIILYRKNPWRICDYIEEWALNIDSQISILDNWYWHNNGSNTCYIKLENSLSPYNLIIVGINFFCDECKLIVRKLIRGGQKEYVLRNGQSVKLYINNTVEIIELSIDCMGPFIPYLLFHIQDEKENQNEIKSTRFEESLVYKKNMERFIYHDQDYLALENFNAQGTILDIGANFGQSMEAFYTLTKSNIISVEADPELCKVLNNVKTRIDDSNRISIINCGIADKKCNIEWFEPDSLTSFCGSFDRTFLEGFETENIRFKIITKYLPCNTLDSLFQSYHDIWFMKLDVENFELKAINGGKKFIKTNYPIILMENNKWKDDVCDILRQWYYMKYYDPINNKFIDTNEYYSINYWLIPKDEYTINAVCREFKQKYSLTIE